MAVIVGTTWQGLGAGISAPAVGQIVRQTHGEVLAQNEHRFRATTQATPFALGCTFSTASTSYVTICEGVWYATYNIVIATAFELTHILAGKNADVRWTISDLDGTNAATYTKSLGATDEVTATNITYSAGSPSRPDPYRVKLEVKAPSGTAVLYAASIRQVDASASALY